MTLDTAARSPIRCSANIAFLFPGAPLEAGLDAASRHGFKTVELIEPYVMPPEDLARLLDGRAMVVDLVNVPFGDLGSGDRGFAGDPSRGRAFDEALDLVATLAGAIRPAKANVLAGFRVPGVSDEEQMACLARNLDRTADRLAPLGVDTVVEMLNPVDNPGYLLDTPDRVVALLARSGGRIGFQLDVHHLARAGCDLLPVIDQLGPYTRHVQIADAPDRTEPGSGTIPIASVLDAVVRGGYGGMVGLEYRPSDPSIDPFAWMEAAGCVRA